jgi:pimeloyl-ACP methyl ester carboxylesterase
VRYAEIAMRTATAIAGVMVVGVSSWLLLGLWIAGGSERFYLLLPPLVVLMVLATAAEPRQWLRGQVGLAFFFVACLALLGTAYGWFWTQTTPVRLVRLVPEILLATYFLVGTVLVTAGTRGFLRRGGHWLGKHCFGLDPAGRRGRVGRLVVAEALPLFLLVTLILAYLLGALYVHRFKIPNALTPYTAQGREFDDVEFVTADGLTIRGWFIPAREPSARTVVICHGLAANRSLFLPYLRLCSVLEANALLFDFRGHGDSDGHTVSFGHREALDVLAAIEFVRTQRPQQAREVVGLGISMGAAALLRAAAEVEQPLDAVIVDSGFASAMDLTDNLLRTFPAPLRPCLTLPGIPLASLHAGCWLPHVRPVDCVSRLRAPILVIHSRHDGLIPSEHAQRLYDAATGPKALLICETDGHGDALFRAEADYLRAAAALLADRPRAE